MSVATFRNGKYSNVDASPSISNAAPGRGAFLDRNGRHDACKTVGTASGTVLSQPEGRRAAQADIVLDPSEPGRFAGSYPRAVADGIDPSKAMACACGSQAMIDAVGGLSGDRGLSRRHYLFDTFVSSASVE